MAFCLNSRVQLRRRILQRGLIALFTLGISISWSGNGIAQTIAEGESNPHKADAESFFRGQVSPFINSYCLECHQNKRPTEAGVNFSPALKYPGHAAFSEIWKKAVARVKAHDMPPDYAENQPTDAERTMFADWLGKVKFLSQKDPGPFVIRRLTKTEYGNTLHDLFGVERTIADELPDEVSGEGYLNSLSSLQLEHYLSIADQVVRRVLPPEVSSISGMHLRLLGKPPAKDLHTPTAVRTVAQEVARRAYRRPPTESELNVLMDVFDMGRQNDLADAQALRLMLKAILVSPQFLFITPADVVGPDDEIVPLDDYQLASRLSYLLWATIPDDQLILLADRGELQKPGILGEQVERMLHDARSRALFDGFGAQWLGLVGFEDKVFDTAKFPQMTDGMRAAMYDEARLFFESIVRENRSVANLVDCDYTFLNETLAPIYGLEEAVSGPEMRKVQLPHDDRGGILRMPGILAATSFPNRTSPVKRGVWVLEQVLGDHVPSAPPDVPALENQDQQTVAHLTLRERTELHRTDPVCANCHQMLDPIGFGLENFDAIGRWREQDDNGEAIDPSGELPGGKRFSGPRELNAIIAAQIDKLSRNLVEKLLAYALCRKLEGYDEIVVDQLMKEIADDGYRMQTLVKAVITSYPFTHRRVREELEFK